MSLNGYYQDNNKFAASRQVLWLGWPKATRRNICTSMQFLTETQILFRS